VTRGVAKFPQPPDAATLVQRAPIGAGDVVSIGPGDLLWRVHRTAGAHVYAWNQLRVFGPANARFDPQPLPRAEHPGNGVLYVATSAVAALAEAFQLRRAIDRYTDRPYLVGLRLARPVRLLDLGALWPTRAGASQALNTGARPRARAWARVIRQAFPDLEGVIWPSSMAGGSRCIALWQPAVDALPAEPDVSIALDSPALLGALKRAADQLGYQVW
jgi:RES domain-containing protein